MLIVAKFVIEKDGSLSNIRVTTKADSVKYKLYLEEAERVIKSMGKWLPAIKNGDSVATDYSWKIRLGAPMKRYRPETDADRYGMNNKIDIKY